MFVSAFPNCLYLCAYICMYVLHTYIHMYALRFQLGHCKISILSHASHFMYKYKHTYICMYVRMHVFACLYACVCVWVHITKVVRVCQFYLLLAGKIFNDSVTGREMQWTNKNMTTRRNASIVCAKHTRERERAREIHTNKQTNICMYVPTYMMGWMADWMFACM